MKRHQASPKYADRMKNYYRELSYRMKAGEDFSEVENFLEELRALMDEGNARPEMRRVANGGWV